MNSAMQQLLSDLPAAKAHVERELQADFKAGTSSGGPLSCALPREIHRRIKLAGRVSKEGHRAAKNIFASHLETSLQKNGHKVTVKYGRRSIEVTFI